MLGSWKESADLAYDLSDAGNEEVQRQVTEHLESCAASTSPAPPRCPFRIPEVSDAQATEPSRQGQWSVLETPELEILPAAGMLWALTRAPGRAEFTRSAAVGGGEAAAVRNVAVDVRGYVYIDPEGNLGMVTRPDASMTLTLCTDPATGEATGYVHVDDADTRTDWDVCD